MNDASRNIDPTALAAALEADQALLVLDVLPANCWEACRLPGALNACVYEMVFADRVREQVADPAAALVVYGAGGESRDAVVAAAKLAELGYTNVRVLDGGLAAWRAAGLPLEGAAREPLPAQAPPSLVAGSWRLDSGASWLRWIGRNPNGFHDGGVDIAEGTVAITDGQVAGRFALDLKTLRNFDLEDESSRSMLIAHLLADDFLHADQFPRVTFELASIAPLENAALTLPTHRIAGSLDLRGVSAALTFDATVTDLGEDRLAVEAHFDLDRTRWGLIYGSARFFAHLGMHVVFDNVGIAMRLVLEPIR